MNFSYIAYGINILSEIEFSALKPGKIESKQEVIHVSLGNLNSSIFDELSVKKTFTKYSQSEYFLELPKIANFYISNGNSIIIEPKCNDYDLINLHFYANALTIALYQRNILLLHVSGVYSKNNKIVLLAAPRGTGKSTTAVQLQEQGFSIFSDDTVRIEFIDGKLYAYASYPMVRMWEDSFKNQSSFMEENKVRLGQGINKLGFLFHDSFNTDRMEVESIVFLEASGNEILVEKMNPKDYFTFLKANFYRNYWIENLKKQVLQFKLLSNIVTHIPAWKATRPRKGSTENEFSKKIIETILK